MENGKCWPEYVRGWVCVCVCVLCRAVPYRAVRCGAVPCVQHEMHPQYQLLGCFCGNCVVRQRFNIINQLMDLLATEVPFSSHLANGE